MLVFWLQYCIIQDLSAGESIIISKKSFFNWSFENNYDIEGGKATTPFMSINILSTATSLCF